MIHRYEMADSLAFSPGKGTGNEMMEFLAQINEIFGVFQRLRLKNLTMIDSIMRNHDE